MEELDIISERRRRTRNSIYRFLYNKKEPCSRQSIAQELDLSMPTVYQNLDALLHAGLISYRGQQASTGGRRAKILSIEPDARFAVGISISEHHLRMLAVDLKLGELAYQEVRHPLTTQMRRYDRFLSRTLEGFLNEHRLDRERLLGVGIVLPGVIDPVAEKVTLSATLHLRDTSLSRFSHGLPYPTYIENDGTCGGFAEWFTQEAQQDLAYLSLESGVGGAVLLGGKQYEGSHRRSGEFGHMCVHPGGLLCSCGKQGCLEAYCSTRRISDDFGVSLQAFFDGLAAGNDQYAARWEELLRHLSIGIANIRMALDCDVVLGGALAEYLPPYLPQLQSYVSENDPFEDGAAYLRLSRFPRHGILLGAALHFIKEFIEKI